MLTKYADKAGFEVLDAVAVPKNAGMARLARARRFAHRHHFDFTPRRGYIYVRSRAISSRCNDNFDEFPAPEIKQAYRTFIGKPVFVNHHNADHRRARGVIIDAALHEDTNPDGSPDTWAEVLMEVDAVRFPVLAREVMKGNIARTSMGTDVAYSECTACGNKASSPVDYCAHIPKMKGMKVRRVLASGRTEEVLVAERCYGLGFFENSLLVEDPADPTAFTLGTPEGDPETLSMFASIEREADAVVAEAEGITRIAGMSVRREDVENYQPRAIDVVASQMLADMHEAFRYDTEGKPYAKPYGGTRPKPQAAPPGTKTYHLPQDRKKPGFGQGSFEHMQEEEREGDEEFARQRRKIQRERAKEKKVPVAASAVEALIAGQCVYCNPSLQSTGSTLMCDSHAFQAAHGAIDFPTSTNMPGGGMYDYPDTNPHPAFAAMMRAEAVGEHFWMDGAQIVWQQSHAAGEHDGKPQIGCRLCFPLSDTQKTQIEQMMDGLAEVRTGEPEIYDRAMRAEGLTYGPGAIFDGGSNVEDLIESAVEAAQRSGEAMVVLELNGREGPVYRVYPKREQAPGGLLPAGDRPPGPVVAEVDPSGHVQRLAMRHVHSYGETKAPAKVDTMRAENCPVCGDDEGFNGDKCNVCGYMQPPSQFMDPDLTKAREQDLRQDAQEQAGIDPAAPGDLGAEKPGAEDLQCTNCGETFSAEGEPATDTDPSLPDEAEAEDADPKHPGHPPDGYGEKAREPDDLADLADTDDEETFDEEADADHEPVPQGEEDDPEETEDPTTFDPAVGEGRVTGEPEDDLGADGLDTPEGAVEGGQCPICGEGTLVLVAPQPEEAGEPKMNQVGTDPTKQKPVAHRHGSVQKEASTDMTAQPNEAQQRRSRMVAAIREQQGRIEVLTSQNHALTQAVATLAVAAGIDRHPKFAGIVRAAGLQRRADDTNNSPEGSPATTTEEAKKPDGTDNVEEVGSAGSEVNKNVTPDAVTDVNNSNVAVNPPVLDNLQSVTEPVSGTDAVVPAAGDAAGTSQVTVKAPSNDTFDGPGSGGWKSSSAQEDSERFTASVRLARLRVAAQVEAGEDFTIGQQIFDSKASTREILAQITALEPVVAQRSQQPQQRQATRHLVPQRAQGIPATRQAAPSLQTQATPTGREGEDEFMIGGDDLSPI